MFAEILIPLALPRNYTWSVPEALRSQVRIGCRVEVNLGRQKRYAGIVKALHEQAPAGVAVKDILSVLDPEPVIQPWQPDFWEWLASYYCCTEGDVMAAALPAHFKLSSETVLVFNDEYGDDFSDLESEEYLVAEALLMKHELRLAEVQQILDTAHVYPVVNKLIGKSVCHVWESLKQTYAPRKETFVVLQPEYSNEDRLSELLNNWSRAPKQMELLLGYLHLMKTEGEVTKSALLKKSGASDAQLKGLVDKGILRTERRNVDRLFFLPKDVRIDFELTAAQQRAFLEVEEALQNKPVCLLHGVTSSGKTLIYIRLIEQLIRQGRQVLYMLPEIALTAQIIRRLQKYFGGHIGIYHSRFNQNERVEIWNKVKTGELKVVLGARSSLFLPFQDLGLIICDEEHDTSYKQQEPAPRYQGRDAAIYLGGLSGAKVLLGSATPSLETYFNAKAGKFGLVELNERYGDVKLPSIQLVDLRAVPRKQGEKVMFSVHLLEEMKSTIARGKQIILFQNRRGYAPYQLCTVCGWIAQCKHCDVSLTYHKFSNKLKCHYCGQVYPTVHTCMGCGSDKLVQKSFGTERIEEVLSEQLPEARVGRMDFDAIRNKNAHDVLIQQFEQKKLDVLVGTQMVVKGLDFDNVELVGVIDADGLLHFADFRVHERAFQLMEQVSGRAGRRDGKGEVLIQTNTPNHPLLQHLLRHDYISMYAEEIDKRRQFFYPPFSRIIMLHFRHKEREVVTDAAHFLTRKLATPYEPYLVGPAEPTVNRVRNQYLMELMVKLPRDSALIKKCKEDIHRHCAALHFENRFKKVQVVVDVDAL